MIHLFVLILFTNAQYDALTTIYNQYVDAYNKRDSTRTSCSSGCFYDIHGVYEQSTLQQLYYLNKPYPTEHPHFCGRSCSVLTYKTPMVHYSKKTNELDNDDICWSYITPTRFLYVTPNPFYVAVHHKNAAVFYPGYQTLSYYDPQDFESIRSVGYGRTTLYILFDISNSNRQFDSKKLGLVHLLNTFSSFQNSRVVIFNNEARMMQGFVDITHSSIDRLSEDVCKMEPYGGTKPSEPFEVVRDYLIRNDLKGNDFHCLMITDMKVYQSKKTLRNKIILLRERVRQRYNAFYFHTFDASEDNTGRSDWLKEFACEFDGHYVDYSGNANTTVGTMDRFIKSLKHRIEALPVHTNFPFVRTSGVQYGVFSENAWGIAKPHYIDFSSEDPLFPLRLAWIFSAAFSTSPNIVPGDATYYPTPTIDPLRKYVLDDYLGHHCSKISDFTVDEREKIAKSISAFNLDWRVPTKLNFCKYDRLLQDIDKTNQSLFCVSEGSCPDKDAFTKADYNFYLRKTCSSPYISVFFVTLLILLF
ncbi:hypothetical protein EIN_186570 [Entamoeba invadens IP1]|uniref:hypothetical protein n=1 Tax=Entamoeba invadens IP1 TaxID=370355 RepID=UPI0002C3D5EC|nr:hypothetical protein EIN_186570 [Entamoeba invadens IP1]ELP94230.1 hypothetical protein EIN_186570 [Entamoeba invadens IP1]|eukprot:XP_004261001.1 hypothetical protein EIN_186570 [Entamoeba invadens IP1]